MKGVFVASGGGSVTLCTGMVEAVKDGLAFLMAGACDLHAKRICENRVKWITRNILLPVILITEYVNGPFLKITKM